MVMIGTGKGQTGVVQILFLQNSKVISPYNASSRQEEQRWEDWKPGCNVVQPWHNIVML